MHVLPASTALQRSQSSAICRSRPRRLCYLMCPVPRPQQCDSTFLVSNRLFTGTHS
ncbi:hypothetical protein IG631_11690 [Alternaria alternata]|nr:hypothetical protein IG631_11690 [Alternaria alternata]